MVDAAFTGHPSYVEMSEIQNLGVPVSFAIPEKDNRVTPEMAEEIKEIVGEKGEVRVYENCGHGFCVRADLKFKDGEIARQAAAAEDQCVAWFERHFERKEGGFPRWQV